MSTSDLLPTVLSENRVNIGQTRSFLHSLFSSLHEFAVSIVSSWLENPTDNDGLLLKHRRRRCEDNNPHSNRGMFIPPSLGSVGIARLTLSQ